eukprot:scaffold3273_cov148-Cylindrotheca_fusiformis.AAC.1
MRRPKEQLDKKATIMIHQTKRSLKSLLLSVDAHKISFISAFTQKPTSIMCQTIDSPRQPLHEQNLIEQLGGKSQYEFINLAFCENILEDERLSSIYEDYDMDSLADLQRNFLDISFQPNHALTDRTARNRIVLQSYALFEKGLRAHHFDRLRKHFLSALRESWVEDDLLDLCEKRFSKLRCIFDNEGKEIEDILQRQNRIISEVCYSV